MLSFSQRKGLKPVKDIIQVDSADERLRNGLWNATYLYYFKGKSGPFYDLDQHHKAFFISLWVGHYGRIYDEMPNHTSVIQEMVKEEFIRGAWNEMYDILEFIPNNYSNEYDSKLDNQVNLGFLEVVNRILEKNLSGFRFVGRVLSDITSKEEIESIESGLASTTILSPVRLHLTRALELYSNKESPDYRNSIKESISAVESLCKIIAGKPKASLKDSLNEIEKNAKLHPALKNALSQLYGYTSDEGGIRHSLVDESNSSPEDARFMLITCSAFVNYLIVKGEYSLTQSNAKAT